MELPIVAFLKVDVPLAMSIVVQPMSPDTVH
jgi:hypothetical protein